MGINPAPTASMLGSSVGEGFMPGFMPSRRARFERKPYLSVFVEQDLE